MTILVAGEINVDLILQGYSCFPEPGKEVLVDDSFLTVGSASLICAMGLAKLGNAVVFRGKSGVDTWGDLCVDAMKRVGIDVSRLIRDPSLKTGITVSITSRADRALVTHLGAITELIAEDLSDDVLRSAQHLHVSSYYLQSRLRPRVRQVFERAHRLGLSTSLDPGFDPSERWEPDLLETLRETDIFFPNEVELRAVSGRDDPVEGLRKLENGRTLIVGKLGRSGCVALENGEAQHVPAFVVDPVDTTGAGDSFNAGFLHAWLRHAGLRASLRMGAACGALSTLGMGGVTSQPDLAQAEEFLRRNP